MKILWNIFVIVFVSVLSWLLSYRFGMFYEYLVPGSGGSFIDGTGLVGMPFAYVFFICLFLMAFGSGRKYLWLFFSLVPAFLMYLLDIRHIYYPVLIGILGWGLGLEVEKGVKMMKKLFVIV